VEIVHSFAPPAPLQNFHDISGFDCGEPTLNSWLMTRAADNMESLASSTYVVLKPGSAQVCGFYSLSMGHLLHAEVSSRHRRNMPEQIPCALIGRLAVGSKFKGLGLGSSLLQDAVLRARRAGEYVAARFVMLHSLNEEATRFYVRHGFVPLRGGSQTLGLDLKLPKTKD
jgi:GNAT superfamily N-acetyltransferase